jgi:ABC-2 type transport system ATP-binding protein
MLSIETNNLTKKFQNLVAVDNISLKVNHGEIFGLLGPNGAGKTTLISMLVTMKKPTSGSAKVNGFEIKNNPNEVRSNIGIVFQDPSLDEELTGYENLEMHAAMYGISKNIRKQRIEEVMKIVELSNRINDTVKTYSGGMRRRLEIARGLLHYPKILFLDEPTIGLDPQTRNHIWEYIKKLKKEQAITIILTTHYMDEADLLCDRIAIIDHGKIIALDSSNNLKNSLGGDVVTIESNECKKLNALFKKAEWIKGIDCNENKINIRVSMADKKIQKIIEMISKNKIKIDSVNIHKPTLDDVFLHYTGKTIREENNSSKESMKIRRKAWGRGR